MKKTQGRREGRSSPNFENNVLRVEGKGIVSAHYRKIVISSMLRHGLRLICIKSNNDHNFVKNVSAHYRKIVISSMLRHGLRLICIKSNNDHNFVKIYLNLPKFGNLGKIGSLNFSESEK